MKRKQIIFVFIGIGIILTSTCIYANYCLNNMLKTVNRSSLLLSKQDPCLLLDSEVELPFETSYENGISNNTTNPETENRIPTPIRPDHRELKTNQVDKNQLLIDVQKKVCRPIEKTDLIKAGVIVLRKLSSEEINYIYQVGQKDSYSQQEYVQVQEILLNKLSDEELNTLREMGKKYGRDLNILNPSLKV